MTNISNTEKLQLKLDTIKLGLSNTKKYVGKALEIYPNILPSLIRADSNEPFLSYNIINLIDLQQLLQTITIDTSLSILKYGDNNIPTTLTVHDDNGIWKLKYNTTSLYGETILVYVNLPEPDLTHVNVQLKNTTEGSKFYLTNLHHVTYHGGHICYYADLYDQDELLETVYKLYKYTQKGELNA